MNDKFGELIPHNIFRNNFIDSIDQQWHRMVDNFFNPTQIGSLKNSIKSSASYPKLDVFSSEDSYCIQASVPGVKPEDLTIETFTEDGARYARISGHMSEEYKDVGEGKKGLPEREYRVKELRRGWFERVVSLPDEITGDPEAVVKDGLISLTWKVPKALPSATDRKVIPLKTK